MKFSFKYFFFGVSFFLLVLSQVVITWPDNKLHVVVCDVGQGDAILVTRGFYQVLIDGGRDDQVLRCLNHHLPIGDRTIELVVATHADADHIGGLSPVLSSFRVLKLMTNQQVKQTADFKQFWQLVQAEKERGMQLDFACVGQVVWLSNKLQLKVISTSGRAGINGVCVKDTTENTLSDKTLLTKSKDKNYNNGSIVLLLSFLEHRYLFTGDLEAEGELALIRSGLLSKINVLKVGHHGSKSSSSLPFLLTLRPEISLISVGKGNPYHHPSPLVINRLLEVGSKVYRTDLSGDIELIDDGVFLKVQTQK